VRYFSLVLTFILLMGLGVVFYFKILGSSKEDRTVSANQPLMEKKIIEDVENKKASGSGNDLSGKDSENFTFYTTLTKDMKVSLIDPTKELKRDRTTAKVQIENLPKKTKSPAIEETVVKETDKIYTASASDKEIKKPASSTYSVQLSAFSKFESAENFLRDLKKKGFNPYIVASNSLSDKTKYKVRLGRFKNIDAAISESVKINSKENLKSFLVKE